MTAIQAIAEDARIAGAWAVLATVPDPEVPVVSVRDLGLVRDVALIENELEVVVTPTYSGCPATEYIASSIIEALDAAGLGPARVRMQRAPAWTTDWMTDEGRGKLRDYGIAPPGPVANAGAVPVRFAGRRAGGDAADAPLACPRCGSVHTALLSAFGSTACKALHRCLECKEPFEHFKPL
ncbi:MAG: phenylacetate-CoA oxygenase subunit PaaJ [Polaromonas sp.]|nr:phenylacetate-CoA oxygenase subunit PaaJ [Polaromonas sp.]MDB5845143.1 phenylacetate-CoA oxygenase subunit PaaJ [Polaromonas sp.]